MHGFPIEPSPYVAQRHFGVVERPIALSGRLHATVGPWVVASSVGIDTVEV